ncbi:MULTISPECIES: DUF5133 domain-containing protein [Streptomyces]|uniref:DUF5133 domain-containing protein n=1 Tax=Streptomyces qinglanensis TaxID=943816 RepID=A0A1E7K4L3_9ACTN|nr:MULTISPECIES: DUF5133 domain-containing protein [Streptomyces]MBE9499537.1 DUF5133 domain-containing protein [Streptomyces sp. GKU 257-1]OEU98860.1 hypothetical protein AN217_14680 [Streptomyces qinglanensis]OEV25127.1 hypothetical protein AN220_15560 [Streptomyces nanshensis]
MLHPAEKTLRLLLARYADARAQHETAPTPATREAVEDLAYTLCVTTDTRSLTEALSAADRMLERHVTQRKHGTRRGRAHGATAAV